MWDPPTEVHGIQLDGITGDTSFRIEMTTPASRDSLYLYRPVIGSESAVLFSLSSTYGAPMLLSLLFLFMGGAIALLSLAFRSFDMRGRRLLYPGLIALAAGTWQFSENTLSVYLTQMPTVLYVLAFAGMQLLVVPIIKLTMLSIDREESPLLRLLLRGLQVSIIAVFALQLAGVVQLSQTSVPFSLALPAIIIILAAYSYYTHARTHTRDTLRYAEAITILALGAVLELANYYVRIVPMVSLVFQVFLLGFVVVTAINAIGFAKRVYRDSLQKLELDRDVQMLEASIDAQKQRNSLVLEHEREIKRLRHDLRHHVVYINTLIHEKRYDELDEYLKGLESSTDVFERRPQTYCENVVANALVAHYADLAAQKGYRFSALLDIPADMPHLTDSDLCVAVGNLLENASEACARVAATGGEPSIDFKTRTQGPLLFIALDNSLESAPKRRGSTFETTKKGGSHGIGLQSIQAIAQKYDGEASFSADEGVFHSSLYLTM